ncbi:hypothetical protein HYZ97_00165, partial [Candidatus Pacearchaeota archaeon]|nr:hypothetical protein [Candidatus Pacearchaeota archaeon]
MWFCEECKQRGVQKKDLENLDVLVASCGGVGTSFFMRFLNRFKKVNCVNNCDGFKHLVAPPPVAQRKFKAVYIYGNPIDAT